MDAEEIKRGYKPRIKSLKNKLKEKHDEQDVQTKQKETNMKIDENKVDSKIEEEVKVDENTEAKCDASEKCCNSAEEVSEENCEMKCEEKLAKAKTIVKNHMLVSAGFGAVPVPLVDLIGLTGTQLNMLKELSSVYEQDFTKEIGKKAIMSLAGGTLSVPVSAGLSSLIKSVPVIGQTAGVISVATIGAAATYAVGEVFIKHFQSGGTFITFDASNFKDYFKEKFSKGKKSVEEMKASESTDEKSEEKEVKATA